MTYDKNIAKHTLVIGGATPASNYVSIPASKNGQTPSLGLTGKYVSKNTEIMARIPISNLFFSLGQIYVLLCAAQNKNFVMHFEYMINDSRVCRLSTSTIYREL